MIYKSIHIDDAVYQTLIDCEISELPISVSKLCGKMGVVPIKNSVINTLNGENGVSINENGIWYIIYDDTQTDETARFTIAKQIGVILSVEDADRFAMHILTPTCVLRGIGAKEANDIAKLCKVNYSIAYGCSRRLGALRGQSICSNPLERRVFANFSEFIKNNKRT